jgi:hypothetical protein
MRYPCHPSQHPAWSRGCPSLRRTRPCSTTSWPPRPWTPLRSQAYGAPMAKPSCQSKRHRASNIT